MPATFGAWFLTALANLDLRLNCDRTLFHSFQSLRLPHRENLAGARGRASFVKCADSSAKPVRADCRQTHFSASMTSRQGRQDRSAGAPWQCQVTKGNAPLTQSITRRTRSVHALATVSAMHSIIHFRAVTAQSNVHGSRTRDTHPMRLGYRADALLLRQSVRILDGHLAAIRQGVDKC